MPLMQGKSKKSFSKNVETEMDEGKPQKQSLAIAYAVMKKNKRKKMAEGGPIKNPPAPDLHEAADKAMKDVTGGIDSRMKTRQAAGSPGYALGGAVSGPEHKPFSRNPGAPAPKPDDRHLPEDEYMADDMDAPVGSTSRGPMITISKAEYDALRSGGSYAKGGMIDRRAESISDAILEKKHRMAEGGMVDLEANSEEVARSPYDKYNADAGDEEQYDLDQLSDDPEDSNESGDGREDDESDKHDMISAIRKRMRK